MNLELKVNPEEDVILVDKPFGLTSSQVVVRLKKQLKLKKVGHAGTLDPIGTGLLVVLVGKATKKQDELMGGVKEYEGEILLGGATDTDDVTGEIIESGSNAFFEVGVSERKIQLERAREKFLGTQFQVAPIYSALKVNGQASYKRARRGEKISGKTREITIYDLQLIEREGKRLAYKVRCSKGTYIRSLARDIGDFLGTKGCLASAIT